MKFDPKPEKVPAVHWQRSGRAGRAAAQLAAAAAVLAGGTAALATPSGAASLSGGVSKSAISTLTAGHAYRHGVVPTVAWTRSHAASTAGSGNLTFQGGVDRVGVTTGHARVYLVFWGSQWGTQTANSKGYATFSGDPRGVAPDLEAFFKGLGTNRETWSGVMTQYCDGVSLGAQSCPATSVHVGYPTGGAFAGLWEDPSAASPARATAAQIANEAVKAAIHFGNTNPAANSSVQYDIISPTGTDPDGYLQNNFCAWHDYTSDPNIGSIPTPWGTPIAFSNMPYLPDAGANCGAGWVNPGNPLDGVTIVNSHEYAETLTDQFPGGGWVDSIGYETGDKCAWLTSGQGQTQNISLATGSFPVQGTWANDYNGGAGGCEVSHTYPAGPAWAIENSANPGGLTRGGFLAAVNCPSQSQCNAVGLGSAQLWSGGTWRMQSVPVPAGGSGLMLEGISCASTKWCAAVGQYNSGSTALPVAEHWNGTSWVVDRTANPANAHYASLTRVACAATNSCYAVGYYNDSAGYDLTLVEHWNGTSWAIVSSPNPTGAKGSQLLGVRCPAANWCAAVGTYDNASGTGLPLAETWNGHTWTVQPTPVPAGSTGSYLVGLGCASTAFCTAVGYYYTGAGTSQALAEQWNGRSWVISPTPSLPGSKQSLLSGVSCPTTSTCVAVGTVFPTSGPNGPYAEIWNGRGWTVEATPLPAGSGGANLAAVACSSATTCTAVGVYYGSRADFSLAERYS